MRQEGSALNQQSQGQIKLMQKNCTICVPKVYQEQEQKQPPPQLPQKNNYLYNHVQKHLPSHNSSHSAPCLHLPEGSSNPRHPAVAEAQSHSQHCDVVSWDQRRGKEYPEVAKNANKNTKVWGAQGFFGLRNSC